MLCGSGMLVDDDDIFVMVLKYGKAIVCSKGNKSHYLTLVFATAKFIPIFLNFVARSNL